MQYLNARDFGVDIKALTDGGNFSAAGDQGPGSIRFVVDRLLIMSFSMCHAVADLRDPHWLRDGGDEGAPDSARSPEERLEVLLDCYSADIRGNPPT